MSTGQRAGPVSRRRNNLIAGLVSAAVTLGGILVVAFVQVAAVLIPLAIGLSGVISGGVAGLTSVLAWALAGVPVSYAVVDRREPIAAAPKPRYAAARVRAIQT